MSEPSPVDCGDNSCICAPVERGGMRTNGGCSCFEGTWSHIALQAKKAVAYWKHRAELWQERARLLGLREQKLLERTEELKADAHPDAGLYD